MAPTSSPTTRTAAAPPRSVECAVEPGLVVEDPQSGYVGAVVRIEGGRVELEDRNGRVRVFPWVPGSWSRAAR